MKTILSMQKNQPKKIRRGGANYVPLHKKGIMGDNKLAKRSVSKAIKKNKGLFLVWILLTIAVFLILPFRNQAYQDDWAYILNVQHFLQSGKIQLTDWTAASSIFPTLWGSLAAKIFGNSIKALHASTLILYLVGINFFYGLLKEFVTSRQATLYTILYAFFPWVLNFAFSFLTDVQYTSLLIITYYFFIKAIKKNKLSYFLIGSLFSGLAYLTRQFAIFLPISVLIYLILQSLKNREVELKKIGLTLFPFALVFFVYTHWAVQPENMTRAQILVRDGKDSAIRYLLPLQTKLLGGSQLYFSQAIYRIIFYYHGLVAFLFFVPFLYKVSIKKLTTLFKKNKIDLLIGYCVYSLIVLFELFFHYGHKNLELPIPRLLLRHETTLPFKLQASWIPLSMVVGIYFVPLIVSFVQTNLTVFLANRKKTNKKIFYFAAGIILTFATAYTTNVLAKLNQYRPPDNLTSVSLSSVKILSGFLSSKRSIDELKSIWLVVTVYTATPIVLSWVIIHKKINLKQIPTSFPLFLYFVFHLATLVFLMYFNWTQYIIPIVPIFLILTAITTNRFSFNTPASIIFLTIYLYLSVSITANRYQTLGKKWEISEELIQQGIAPIDIEYHDESWPRYWYFDSEFAKLLKERNNDKNNISVAEMAVWTNVVSNSDYVYHIVETNLTPKEERSAVMVKKYTKKPFTNSYYAVTKSLEK